MKRKLRRYTPEEDAIILQAISTYPTNLDVAFEQAAAQLRGRTKHAVAQHWYKIKHEGSPTMAIATRDGVMLNTKTVRRPKEAPRGGISAFEMAQAAMSELTSEEIMTLFKMMIRK